MPLTRARAARRQHLDRHDLGAEGDAGDADAVVGRLRDGAGDVRAVAVIVAGVGAVVDEVPAGDDLGLRQIRHLGDAGVDDGDDHALALRGLPGLLGVDLLQVPLQLVLGIVGEVFVVGANVVGRQPQWLRPRPSN